MSRSRSRLAADWFARLRHNVATNVVEHLDLEAEKEATAVAAQAVIDAKVAEDVRIVAAKVVADTALSTAIGNIDMSSKLGVSSKAFDADKLDGINSTQFVRSDTGTIDDARLPATISSNITGNAATASNADKLDNLNSTDFLRSTKIVKSNTQPSNPVEGDMWYDDVNNVMKVWDGNKFDQMSNKFTAIGGIESTYSSGGVNYKVHTFTSSGTFTAETSGSVDYLVIAGGGAGGAGTAGGGGAGGYRASTSSVNAQQYTITVGAGGAGGTTPTVNLNNGNNSVFGSIASIGGGYGGSTQDGATGLGVGSGGSGGGSVNYGSHQISPGLGTSGQGNNGGSYTGGAGGGAGGGGAGAVGGTYTGGSTGGAGGAGASSSITGSSVTRAGGGGGGANGTVSAGGTGGGGNGAGNSTGTTGATSGSTNTGSGGGGSWNYGASFYGSGGSGIVIIRYAV